MALTDEYAEKSDKKAWQGWNYAEDKKLIENVFQLKKIRTKNVQSMLTVKRSEFKDIAPEFDRSASSLYYHWRNSIVPSLSPHLEALATSKSLRKDVLDLIEARFENTNKLFGYSEDDKKFIIREVKMKGDLPETWIFIAKQLVNKTPDDVKFFYYTCILQRTSSKGVKGSFTSEEDEIILRHVEEHGKSKKSFKDLTEELSRGSPESVEVRHRKLISANEYEVNTKQKAWTLDEDKSLIYHIFKVKEINTNNASLLENMKENEITAIATQLKRSSSSCYTRWMQHIVPTLKTHLKKLPMTNDWKKGVLSYIIANNIQHKQEMDINQILKVIAPGQTSRSVSSFLDELKRERINSASKQNKIPLCDFASKVLKEQSPYSTLFNDNHKKEQKRLEWCQNVISYYKTLI